MITEAELIVNKWRKLEENNWKKLGVILRILPHHIHLEYFIGNCVYPTPNLRIPSIDALESYIKDDMDTITHNPRFKSRLTVKQKRTYNNWIL